MSDDTMRERCRAFLSTQMQNAIMRQGSPVDDLIAFIVSEKGRAADPSLAETLPLCLYFVTEADREEFIEAVRQWKPNMIQKKMP